jgi:two-component system LytT family response regulator
VTEERIRVLIIEDEPIAQRGIRQLLASQQDIEIVGQALDGRQGVHLLNLLQPDLIFLDVQMPGLDGFEILRRITATTSPAIIFVTAYESFAVRAFDSHAVDYLVKPIGEARFAVAMSRARDRLRFRQATRLVTGSDVHNTGVGESQQPGSSLEASTRRLIAISGGSKLIFEVADIAWIEADDYYACLHVNAKRYLVRESLASLEARLDRRQFVRAHRRALVNLACISEIRSSAVGQSELVLRDGSLLPMSRRRRGYVQEAMLRFAG